MEIRAAIVEDNPDDSDKLKKLLLKNEKQISFDIFEYSDETSEELIQNECDIYFLDIDMPKANGIELAKVINNNYKDAKIIFVSNREDLVFETQLVKSFYFVRKEKLDRDLENALNRIVDYFGNIREMYVFEMNRTTVKIFCKDIIYFEKNHNDIKIHLNNGTVYTERNSFKNILKVVDNSVFFRTYSSYIVNLKYVSMINSKVIYLDNGEIIYVSKRKNKEIQKAFFDYVMRKASI